MNTGSAKRQGRTAVVVGTRVFDHVLGEERRTASALPVFVFDGCWKARRVHQKTHAAAAAAGKRVFAMAVDRTSIARVHKRTGVRQCISGWNNGTKKARRDVHEARGRHGTRWTWWESPGDV